MSIENLTASQRVISTAFGDVLGCSFQWPGGQYCSIHTDHGILGCGLYDCSVGTRFGMAIAIARGTPEKPLYQPEDLLEARIAEVSDAALGLGIKVGMKGIDALRLFCSRTARSIDS